MAKENITIKDIAARAGVSTGTVDRVLHNRPNVSKAALEKVNKALEEMDYRPNMYASALAYNKEYTFYCVLPKHEQEAYWDEIEEGAMACTEFRRDFGIKLKFVYYERFNPPAFTKMVREFLSAKIDGVIIVPATLEQTARFTEKLIERNIPYVLLDSYMPDLKPLSFFGQDSFASGYFAAKMLMLIANKEKEIALMKQTRDGIVGSKQQANRETGFRHYMVDHFPKLKLQKLIFPSMRIIWSMMVSLRSFSQLTPMCIIVSHSIRRHTSWVSSYRKAIAVMFRLWVMIWCQETRDVCAMEVSHSLSPSTLINKDMPVWMRCLTLSL